MDPTALPTDNLYKFMALAGVLAAGFCIWLAYRIWNHIIQRADQMEIEEAQLSLRFDAASARAKLFEAQSEAYAQDAQRAGDTASREQAFALIAGRQDALPAERRQLDSLEQDRATLAHKRKALHEVDGLGTAAARGLLVACACAVAVSMFGFILWYTRVQWYADKQAKAEFEDRMAELAAKRKARDAASWAEQHKGR